MTERDLLDRFITDKDPDAFRVLIDLHGPMVLSVCRDVLHEQHDAEDAFQNTFLILASRATTIKHSDSIAPWLHRVAVRTARRVRLKAAQRRDRERNRFTSEVEYPPDAPDFSLLKSLREEVSRLPDCYRLPVVLCYLEGKSNTEAALQLRCPVGTIKGRLSRARKTLRDRLIRRGVESHEGPLGTIPRG